MIKETTQALTGLGAWKEVGNHFSGRRHAALQSTKNALFAFPHLAHLLTKKGRKMAVSPSLTIKNRSKTMERHEKPSKLFGKEKTLEPLRFQGFLMILTRDHRLQNSKPLSEGRRTLPKNLLKMTEMVLRLPLSFP